MRSKVKVALSIFVIVLIGYITKDIWINYPKLYELSYGALVYISLLFLSAQICNGYKLYMFLKRFDVNLKFFEWFGLVSIRSLGNYLPLSAGSIYNSIYLKYNKNFSYSHFAAVYSVNIIFLMASSSTLGVLLNLIIFIQKGYINLYLLGLFLLLIFFQIIILFPTPVFLKNHKIRMVLLQLRGGIDILKSSPVFILKIFFINVFVLILLSFRFFVIFKQLDLSISLIETILIISLMPILNLITVIPGNLGIRESILGGLAELTAQSFSNAFMAGIIDRVVTLLWIFMTGVFFYFKLFKKC